MRSSLLSAFVVFLVIVAAVVYVIFFRVPAVEVDTSISNTTTALNAVPGRDFIVLLEELKTITLDDSVFSHSVFQRLIDERRPLLDEDVSRPHPFAPIGIQ